MRALVASDDSRTSVRVAELLLRNELDCPADHVVSLDVVEKRLFLVRPELVVLVLSPNSERALATLREIRGMTKAHIVALGPADEPKLILRTLREGADQYLDETELEAEIDGLLERLTVRSRSHAEPGRLIAIVAPSGGAGASTMAVNVAAVLAGTQSALLCDLKVEAGDLATLLDLKPTHTLADFCQNLTRMDRSMFEQLLIRHTCGVHLLAAPGTRRDGVHVTPDGVREALNMARAMFSYVVADLDHAFREEQIEALGQADLVIVVFRLDFSSLRNTRSTLDHMEQMGIDLQHVRLVANRYGQRKHLSVAQAEEALGVKIQHYVRDDPKTVNRANNNGSPVVLERPSARVSVSITEIASSVNGLYNAG